MSKTSNLGSCICFTYSNNKFYQHNNTNKLYTLKNIKKKKGEGLIPSPFFMQSYTIDLFRSRRISRSRRNSRFFQVKFLLNQWHQISHRSFIIVS